MNFSIVFFLLHLSCIFFSNLKEIDFSQHDFPREIWFSKPSSEIVYKLIMLMPIILCGVIGNLLLLNVVFKNRALHTPTNYILSNMIVADTLTLVFCPAMFICGDFFQNFILGTLGCKGDGFLQGSVKPKAFVLPNLCCCCCFFLVWVSVFSFLGYFSTLFLSKWCVNVIILVTFLLTAVLNLCVVSYDRLTAIVLPMEKRITMRGAKMTMLLTWIVGLTISIPFAVYRNYKV